MVRIWRVGDNVRSNFTNLLFIMPVFRGRVYSFASIDWSVGQSGLQLTQNWRLDGSMWLVPTDEVIRSKLRSQWQAMKFCKIIVYSKIKVETNQFFVWGGVGVNGWVNGWHIGLVNIPCLFIYLFTYSVINFIILFIIIYRQCLRHHHRHYRCYYFIFIWFRRCVNNEARYHCMTISALWIWLGSWSTCYTAISYQSIPIIKWYHRFA